MGYLLFVLGFATTVGFGATEVFFSPSADCENRITQAIADSHADISVAVYSLNNRKISEALQKAKERGVKVRILTDSVQASSRSSTALPLLNAGLDVRLNSKFKIEHNKFGIYDGKLVSTGSFNWTGAASRSNSENCVFLDDPGVISKFSERFEFLWGINTADGSKSRIQKLLRRRERKDLREPQTKKPAVKH